MSRKIKIELTEGQARAIMAFVAWGMDGYDTTYPSQMNFLQRAQAAIKKIKEGFGK